MHRFLLDNDGHNFLGTLGDDVEAAVAETVRECPSQVTTYLLCSGAGTSYWPTKIGVVDPRSTGLIAAHQRGLDPLGMLLAGLKASGKETIITCRMNDVHNPTDADAWNTPVVRREHPECVVGAAEIAAGTTEWMSYCLDYAQPVVQQYVLGLILEQVELYGDTIDGFQLDWMRFPRHLAGTPAQVWAQRAVITDFIAQVRAVLDASGHRLSLAARVPTTLAGCRHLGFDIGAWASRELIDYLVVCPFLTTDWSIPVADFRAVMAGHEVPVYAGFDFGFGAQHHMPESLRAICTSLYECGADGIYIFNFPCWSQYLQARPYHWLSNLDHAATASAKPLLFAVQHNRHRIAGVDQTGQLPVKLAAGTELTLTLELPAAALPAERALLLVHSHGDIGVSINGVMAAPMHSGNGHGSTYRSEIFCEFVDQYFAVGNRPKPEDCRNFSVAATALRSGTNTLVLTNPGPAELEIERVNLGLW